MTEGNKYLFKNLLKSKYLVTLSVIIEALLFYFYYFPETKILLGDENRYLETGLSIASGEDWHNHPFWPPMQSIVIAIFAKIFNNPILPLQFFQYGLLILSGFIVRDITFRETRNQTAAQLALAVMILYPSWLAYSQYLWPEVIHVLLFVAIIWINKYKHQSYKWMLLSGLLLGLVILFKSLLILFIPFLYLPLIINSEWKNNSMRIILSLLVAVVVMSPASFKAHKMTGDWMVANSSMFNLNLGLHDDSRQHFTHKIAGVHYKQYQSSSNSFKQRNIIVKQKAITKIKEAGYFNTFIQQFIKQYFRLFDYQSFFSQQFQGDEKDNYLSKYQLRYDHPLVMLVLIFNTVFYCVIMIAMLLGLFVSVKKSIIAQQFAWFLLYVLGLFLLLHSIPRFRIPLLPIMGFYSGYLYYYIHTKTTENVTLLSGNKSKLMLSLIVMVVMFVLFSAQVLDKYYPF